MPIFELEPVCTWVLALSATYLMHSSVLLGGAWLVFRSTRVRSFALRERVWKSAALIPFATVPLQVHGFGVRPIVEWALPIAAAQIELATAGEARGDSEIRGVANFGRGVTSVDDVGSAWSSLDDWSGRHVGVVVKHSDTRDSISSSDDLRGPKEAPGMKESGQDSAVQTRQRVNPAERAPEWGTAAVQLTAAATGAAGTSGTAIDATTMRPLMPGRGPGVGWTRLSMIPACGLLVLVCVSGGLLRLIILAVRTQREIAQGMRITKGAAYLALQRLCARSAVARSIRLLTSGACREPAAVGVLRWTILIPADLEERLRHDELQAVLAHELGHLVRGDTAWLWIEQVLCGCLAFQPLHFPARREWHRAAEHLCDEWAVRGGVDRMALARCLTRLADWRLARVAPPPGLAAAGTPSTLSGRVERLMAGRPTHDPWTDGGRRRAVRVGALLLAALVAGWGPRATWDTERAAAASDSDRVAAAPTAHTPVIALSQPEADSSVNDEETMMQAELADLLTDLDRVNRLLVGRADDEALQYVAKQLRQRLDSIRRRWITFAQPTHSDTSLFSSRESSR